MYIFSRYFYIAMLCDTNLSHSLLVSEQWCSSGFVTEPFIIVGTTWHDRWRDRAVACLVWLYSRYMEVMQWEIQTTTSAWTTPYFGTEASPKTSSWSTGVGGWGGPLKSQCSYTSLCLSIVLPRQINNREALKNHNKTLSKLYWMKLQKCVANTFCVMNCSVT